MKQEITIVDRGRGPQLSTSRITVQDLVPYLQRQWSHEKIQEIMPVLSDKEIEVVEKYFRDHYEQVMEQDRHIRERANARCQPDCDTEAERQRRLERLQEARKAIRQGQLEPNGDRSSR